MLIGVVSDTHNNSKNIDNIIDLFNKEPVDIVIHTGDITNSKSIAQFSRLNSKLIGVFGNNDKGEINLKEVIKDNLFDFDEPPKVIHLNNKCLAIFHEPDDIQRFLEINKDIDIVLHGHTHRYRKEFIGDVLLFNPGESAGMQKGSNAIATINLNNFEIKRIFF